MAQNDLFKRYLDAGLQFSQMTQQRAEAFVRDLVSGEVQAEQTQALVNDLVERSRRNTERLVEQIRAEVRAQLDTAEVVTKDVVARLQSQIDDLRAQLSGAAAVHDQEVREEQDRGQEGVVEEDIVEEGFLKEDASKRSSTAKKTSAKAGARTTKKASAKKRATKKSSVGAPPASRATAPRRRLDAELVRRGLLRRAARRQLTPSPRDASRCAAPGHKPARLVAAAEPIELQGPPPRFVSRGGDKLDAALEQFGIDVDGRSVLDAGASTGGFTDCVLQRGAAQVVAVDVGHGQLHERLRRRPPGRRPRAHERPHARRRAIGGDGRPRGRRPVVHLAAHRRHPPCSPAPRPGRTWSCW